MGKVVVKELDLDNFQFEELDNRLIDEIKELVEEETDEDADVVLSCRSA